MLNPGGRRKRDKNIIFHFLLLRGNDLLLTGCKSTCQQQSADCCVSCALADPQIKGLRFDDHINLWLYPGG